jgi:hypothetical protein
VLSFDLWQVLNHHHVILCKAWGYILTGFRP